MYEDNCASRRTLLKTAGGAITGLSLFGSAGSASAEPAITSERIKIVNTARYEEAVDYEWQPRRDIYIALEDKFNRDLVTSDPNENYSFADQDVEYSYAQLDCHDNQNRRAWEEYVDCAILDEFGRSGHTTFVVLDYLPDDPYEDADDPLFFQPVKAWEYACAIGVNWRFVEERDMDLKEKYPELYWDIQGTKPPTPYPPYTDYGYDDAAAAVTYSLLQTLTGDVFSDTDYGSALTSMPYAGGMAGPWGSGVPS